MRVALSNAARVWGGAERMTVTVGEGLQARGLEVLLLCRAGSPLHHRAASTLRCAPVLGGMDLSPRTVLRSANALRRFGADVVVTFATKDARWLVPAARLLGVPIVVRQPMDRPLPRSLYHRVLYAGVERWIANSESTRATLLRTAGIPPERIVLIRNGFDVERFARAEPADLGLPPDALAVGFIGRLERRKGIFDLAAAWPRVAARVRRAHLVVAGTGPDEAALRAALAAAPRVRWLGFVEDPAPVLRALAVLVMPSHFEGFGLAAAEALAAGVPVVATSTSSLPEIVAHERTGWLVPPRDPTALADALGRLLEDAPLRRRLGAAGAEDARARFDRTRMLDEFEALLLEVAR